MRNVAADYLTHFSAGHVTFNFICFDWLLIDENESYGSFHTTWNMAVLRNMLQIKTRMNVAAF